METKKISFSFTKTKKQEKPIATEKKEYIECVEEKSIKVLGGEVAEETAPLIIPMKPNTLMTTERLNEIAEKVEKDLDEQQPVKNEPATESKPTENETLDQMAVRELLQEAKKEQVVEAANLVLPVPAKMVMDGQKESTLEDYESVPVQEFGLAMLRGMGWQPNKEQSKYKQPQLRPKGLGLGADKVITENQKKKSSKDNKEEELSIAKNGFVKITNGRHNGYYGKVVSLDDDNGRVLVDITIKKETVTLNEFMMHPVTKAEYDKQSKVINAESYDDYKKKQNIASKSTKSEREGSTSQRANDVDDDQSKKEHRKQEERHRTPIDEEKHSNGRNKDKSVRNRKNSSSSEEYSRNSRRKDKDKKRYSSHDSLSSSDSDKRHSSKYSRRRSSSDKDRRKKNKKDRSRSPKEKRDIDKKRKGKKKRRDRDRSPNYRKHKK